MLYVCRCFASLRRGFDTVQRLLNKEFIFLLSEDIALSFIFIIFQWMLRNQMKWPEDKILSVSYMDPSECFGYLGK